MNLFRKKPAKEQLDYDPTDAADKDTDTRMRRLSLQARAGIYDACV